MHSTHGPLCHLPPAEAARLEALINRFEDAWQNGNRPAIAEHLPAGEHQLAVLVELVHIDLEKRIKAGEPARVEDYLNRFPSLGKARSIVLELIEAERVLRERFQKRVEAQEYVQRFPEYRDELPVSTTASQPGTLLASPTVCLPPSASGAELGEDAPPETDSREALVTRSRYRIVRLHARGGLGEVLTARDGDLNREVALKRLQEQRARDPESRSRFLREAEITGQLEHPGVVPVYGLGTAADGSPIYAMRFIRGENFQEAIDRFHRAETTDRDPSERTLAFRQLLSRLVSVCNTIGFAHSRGILHRDIKPGNILLGDFGETLVVDWGLAKCVGDPMLSEPTGELTPGPADLTREGAIVGTPAYMSPEQAGAAGVPVGPASDVYSLGVTLYVLLTGQSPFGEGGVYTILERVKDGDFQRPRQLKKGVAPALEAVCLQAMASDPQNRYPTPLALAADLELWLAGEPVSSWSEPVLRQALRWVRRHATGVAVATVGLIALAIVAVLASLLASAAERGRLAQDRARIAQELADERAGQLARADRERYYSNLATADRNWWSNRFDQTLTGLAACKPELRRWEWNHLMRRCQDGLVTLTGHDKEVWKVVYNPDGKRLASASLDGSVRVWDPVTGQQLLRQDLGGPVWSVAYSPEGDLLAAAIGPSRNSRTRAEQRGTSTIRLLNAATGEELFALEALSGEVEEVAFRPGGRHLAAAVSPPPKPGEDTLPPGPGEILVWDVTTKKRVHSLKLPARPLSLAYSPDGKRLAAGAFDYTVGLWDAESGVRLPSFKGHEGPLRSVSFSPDSSRLASASLDGTVRIWNVLNQKETHRLVGHARWVWGVSFSPDGTRLASSSDDSTVRVWDLATARTLLILHGHRDGIASVVYSPDGTRLASASDDQTVRIWDATTSRTGFACGHTSPAWGICYTPDGKQLAVATEEYVQLHSAATGRVVRTLPVPAGAGAVAVSSNGRILVAALDDGTIRLWDAATGDASGILRGHRDPVLNVALSPDGRLAASASLDRTVRLWDVAAQKEIRTLQANGDIVRALAFSPEGRRLAWAGDDKVVRLWDVAGEREEAVLPVLSGAVRCLAFSPNGSRLAVGTATAKRMVTQEPGEITLWDLETRQQTLNLRGHLSDVRAVAFSPDGQRLASGGTERWVKVWEATTGQEIVTLVGQLDGITGIAFSPDGHHLASSSLDGTVLLRDGAPVGD